MSNALPCSMNGDGGRLIRSVNRLFHDLTQERFDREHQARFVVESVFWHRVAGLALDPQAAPRVVVDVACGSGLVPGVLADYLRPGDRLIPIDLGVGPLGSTRRKWLARTKRPVARLHPLAGDAERLALADASVDLVTLNAALHHMPNPAAVLAEMHRIVRPGGWLAVGHEPNRGHFASPALRTLSAGFTRLCWYTSPAQNRRRLWTLLGRPDPDNAVRRNLADDARTAERISAELTRAGLCREPLTAGRMLDLLDPHARGGDDHGGLELHRLIRECLPGCEIVLAVGSDYLGEYARRLPIFRRLTDGLLRIVAPDGGSLVSVLLRKNAAATRCGTGVSPVRNGHPGLDTTSDRGPRHTPSVAALNSQAERGDA